MRFGALAVFVFLTVTPLGATATGSPPDPTGDPPQPSPAFVPFSTNLRVNSGNPTYQHQVEPTMAINSQGRLFVGWKEAFTHDGGGQRVAFSYSADGGGTWAPNVFMALNRTTRQSDPWLSIADDGHVYFTRLEFNSAFTVSGITVSNTTDGISWGTPHYYSDSPMFADKETAAHDAAGSLYWAWNTDDPMTNVQNIVVTRSDDGGRTWISEASVPDPGDGVIGAFVDVHPNDTVLLAWWSYFTDDIWLDRSFDGGVTWGTDTRVNDSPGSAGGWNGTDWVIPLPAMEVAADGTVYVVWPDHRAGNHDIMFSRSMDAGSTWSPTLRLNNDVTTADQWMPDLAVDPFGGVHVAWMDDRNGAHDVYYVNSTNGGTTWGPNVRVTTVPTALSYTRPGDYLALESDRFGHIYVVWTDGRGTDLDIYFAKLERTVLRSIDTVPPGLTVEVDGVPYTAPHSFVCQAGTQHTIHAPSPQGSSLTRHTFAFWDDGGTRSHDIGCSTPGTSWAFFFAEHAVTLATWPPNLNVTFDGVSYAASRTFWVLEGASAWIGAPGPQVAGPTRYLFGSWSDGGADFHPIDVKEPMILVATFRTEHFLTMTSPHGSVSCDLSDCWYRAGETATFAVQPEIVYAGNGTRHVFQSWSGDASGSGPIGSVLMDRPRTVAAAWSTEYYLWVESAYGNPVGVGWHEAGSVVTVEVEPTVVVRGKEYRFAGWSGDENGNNATLQVTMVSSKTVRALWEEVPRQEVDWFHSLPAWIFSIAVSIVILLVFLWRRRGKDDDEAPPSGPPPM